MSRELDFDKMGGLVPAVVQDASNGEVLMVGFMNRPAMQRTLQSGYVTFFSRTRNEVWTKGESSGNRLRLISSQTDCDRDSHRSFHGVTCLPPRDGSLTHVQRSTFYVRRSVTS